MRKLLYILFFSALLFSCQKREKNRVLNLVKDWTGKNIFFPEQMRITSLARQDFHDSIFFVSNYKILVYVDSTGCFSCKLRLLEWRKVVTELNSVPVLFYFVPSSIKEIESILKENKFDFFFCIDKMDSLNKLNSFPEDERFQTILLNKSNNVVAIGNPVYNPKVKELYLKIIQGEKVEQESGTKVVMTEVGIDKTSVFLGHFDWQKEQKVAFTLKNTGDKPLVVQDVNTSCGCTSVSYSKEPVQPGGELKLEVMYAAEHPEHFNKTITVYCNAESSPLVLKIVGDAE